MALLKFDLDLILTCKIGQSPLKEIVSPRLRRWQIIYFFVPACNGHSCKPFHSSGTSIPVCLSVAVPCRKPHLRPVL